MNKTGSKQILILVILFLFHVPFTFSQENGTSCKVLLKEISGTYKGDCINGLADGKGTATGEDQYVGSFKNGLPEGKGVYTYKNGSIYTGNFKNGLKDGKGKFKQQVNGQPLIITGYWQGGDYVGVNMPDEEYRINRQTGIGSYSIKRTDNNENSVVISFEKSFTKYIPNDLSFELTGGYKIEQNKSIVALGYVCPVQFSMHYTIKIGLSIRECFFTFTVLKPGKYEVLISND
jgi:hypothetical protein